jgi:hypothetical protein
MFTQFMSAVSNCAFDVVGIVQWADRFIHLIWVEGNLLVRDWKVGAVSIKASDPPKWVCH